MIKSKFAISLHILCLLASKKDQWVSSECIAGSLNANPALIRKELSALRQVGLVVSKEGKNGGAQLAKPAEETLLSEIFCAVKEEHVFGFSKNEPNPECQVGAHINSALCGLYHEIDQDIAQRLSRTSLHEFSLRLV